MKSIELATVMLGLLTFSNTGTAQSINPTVPTDQNRSGDLPFSSNIGEGIEHVDMSSGALQIHIPLIQNSGRGQTSQLALSFNSNLYAEVQFINGVGNPQFQLGLNVYNSWHTGAQARGLTPTEKVQCPNWTQAHQVYTIYRRNTAYIDPLQARHDFAAIFVSSLCSNTFSDYVSGPDFAAAGMWSGYSTSILDADGRSTTGVGDFTNSNGNFSSMTVDPLGRTFYSTTTSTNADGSLTYVYTYTDSNGAAQSVTVAYEKITIVTHFGYGDITGEATAVVKSVTLANGQQYKFSYEPDWGMISEIDLPTGGVITYQYANTSGGSQDANLGGGAAVSERRYVTTRKETVNGSAASWNIVIPSYGSYMGAPSISTVTFPTGHQTVLQSVEGSITDAKVYASAASGTPLREYQMLYAQDTNPLFDGCYNDHSQDDQQEYPKIGTRLTSLTTILEGTLYSQKQFDYDSVSYNYPSDHCISGPTFYNYTTSRGNVTEERDYDWGSGAPGSLIRKVDKTYLHISGPNAAQYVTANIVDRVLSDTVYDGSGNQSAQTQYVFDDYATGDGGGMTSTSGAPGHDYTNYSSTNTLRGNLTQVKRWLGPGTGTLIRTAFGYDDLGNVRSSTDALGNLTTWSYVDSWANNYCQPSASSYAYPTSKTEASGTAIAETIQVTYYPCSGLQHSIKGPNDISQGRPGTVVTYDLLGRPTLDTLADLGSTSFTYCDFGVGSCASSPSTTTAVNVISTSPALSLTSIAEVDGLGRPRKTTTYTSPAEKVYSRMLYDQEDHKAQEWNPSYCDPDTVTTCAADGGTFGYTQHLYDALDRETKTIPPDGTSSVNNIASTYSLNTTTIVDQAGASHTTTVDTFGRIIKVSEGSEAYITQYGYDVLGNLLCVEQHGGVTGTGCSSAQSQDASSPWRVRRFTYDTLSRLITTTNPETGFGHPITYSYDTNGNVLTKTDSNGNVTNYSPTGFPIDSLGRVTKKTYTVVSPTVATAPVSYSYDSGVNGIGYRTGMLDGSGSTSWTYDQLGRQLSEQRTIGTGPGIQKTGSTLYNLDGSVRQITYPSGTIVTVTPGDHGLPSQIADSVNTYASGITYGPSGLLTRSVRLATGTFAGVTQTDTYNSRFQPGTLTANAPAGTRFSLTYDFGLGTNDNGNVNHIYNNKVTDHSRDQSFTYDDLNRLKTARNGTWGMQFIIDAWGSLYQTAGISGSGLTNAMPLPTDMTANNQNQLTSPSTGISYTAGNLVANGGYPYTYDAENRLITANGATYTYDGDGNRVKTSTGTLYWGAGPLSESDLSGNNTSSYFYLGGQRIARRDASGLVYSIVSDHLGSGDMVLASDGTILNESDFVPYGGQRTITTGLANEKFKFTGEERDNESGLDYFGARYYASSMGRFMSPDWAARAEPVPYAKLDNPQSLNLYGYVLNNPLSKTDPDGHCCWDEFKAIFYAKGSVGPGVGSEVKLTKYLSAGVSAKAVLETKATSNGVVTTAVAEVKGGVKVGPADLSVKASAEAQVLKNGVIDAKAPELKTTLPSIGSGPAEGTPNELGVSGHAGAFGGEVGIDLDKVMDLGSAMKQSLSDLGGYLRDKATPPDPSQQNIPSPAPLLPF